MRIGFASVRQHYILVFALCSTFNGLLSAQDNKIQKEAREFLKKYGHYKDTADNTVLGSAIFGDSDLRQAILSYQDMTGLPLTGTLNDDTLEMMSRYRCGLPDYVGYGSFARRKKRYVAEGSRWNTTSLTFNFMNYTNQLPRQTTRNIVVKAFSLWAAGSSTLSFTETSSTAHIHLKYATGWHNDGFPFDGRGGVLAHAYFPDAGGQAHFDDAEYWTDNSQSGTNLLQVTTHEIGHTLGLGHSNMPGAVMAPTYNGYNPLLTLGQDDIDGIRFLYPTAQSKDTTTARTTPPVTAKRTTPPKSDPFPGVTTRGLRATPPRNLPSTNICSGAVIDAIVVADGTTFAFVGDSYYIFDNNGVRSGYPRGIAETWPQVGGSVDTALYYDPALNSNGQMDPGYLFLFKGSQVWKFMNSNQLLPNYPRPIREGFPGIPDNLDASFVWSGSGDIFFIKGDQYYRYIKGQGADPRYPMPMSRWIGIPSNVNTAFKWINGRTYFFAGDQYYRFNDFSFMVDSGYPRNTGEWWFGCSSYGFGRYPENIKISEYDEGLAGISGSDPGKLQKEIDEGSAQFVEVGLGGNNSGVENSLNFNLFLSLCLVLFTYLVFGLH